MERMKRKYYILELDTYNQPSGIITEVELTFKEYKQIANTRGYIFKDYIQAVYRAND